MKEVLPSWAYIVMVLKDKCEVLAEDREAFYTIIETLLYADRMVGLAVQYDVYLLLLI